MLSVGVGVVAVAPVPRNKHRIYDAGERFVLEGATIYCFEDWEFGIGGKNGRKGPLELRTNCLLDH